jgi:hypothetical protein
LWTKDLNVKDIHEEIFPVYDGKRLSRKAIHSDLGGKRFADEEAETEVRKWLRQQSKISMLRVSTHWKNDGTSVSMLVEDISRSKCFFRCSNITRFTFYIHLRPIY